MDLKSSKHLNFSSLIFNNRITVLSYFITSLTGRKYKEIFNYIYSIELVS